MSIKLDDITIVLPTRNEARDIQALLNSIPSSVIPVVVDASEDSTPDPVTSLRPDRTLVMKHPGSINEARQLGAESAQTPWLLFTEPTRMLILIFHSHGPDGLRFWHGWYLP